jgi:hypothetical protein
MLRVQIKITLTYRYLSVSHHLCTYFTKQIAMSSQCHCRIIVHMQLFLQQSSTKESKKEKMMHKGRRRRVSTIQDAKFPVLRFKLSLLSTYYHKVYAPITHSVSKLEGQRVR